MIEKHYMSADYSPEEIYYCNQFYKAKDIATEAHEGQQRWNKDPYITHCHRIAETFVPVNFLDGRASMGLDKINWTINNFILGAISYLHDVLEDCVDYTADRLIKEGLCTEIVWPVIILTKLPGEKYLPYLLRLKESNNNDAYRVKIADIKDNLRDLATYDRTNKQIDRYEMALHILQGRTVNSRGKSNS